MYGSCAERRALALAAALSILLGLVRGLHAEKRRVVRALAVHQRNQALVGELLLAAVRDGHFRRAFQGHVAFIRAEGVRR